MRRTIVAVLTLLFFSGHCYAKSTDTDVQAYTFNDITFEYPKDWVIQAKLEQLTVAPKDAFIKRANGSSFVKEGFFLGKVAQPSTVDGALTKLLTTIQTKQPQLKFDTSKLFRYGNPVSLACAFYQDPIPPYAGTETGKLCTLQVGQQLIWTLMFSPTTEWDQFTTVFTNVLASISTNVTPNSSQIPIPKRIPSTSPAGCQSDRWIDSNAGDGKYIKLSDGSIYEIDSVDTVTTSIWLAASNVIVCGTKMINIDEGETAEIARIVSGGPTNSSSNSAKHSYEIQASDNDETFVIQNEVFKAKTYCFGFEKNDKVIFVQGSPSGVCVSAEILNLKNNKVCRVWCP